MCRVIQWKPLVLHDCCCFVQPLATHLQYVLPSWFVVFTLKLVLVWKCPFGPSPWHLWVWSPCHFGSKYSYFSCRTIENILSSQWLAYIFKFFFFLNTNCINISGLEICCGEAHLVIYLLVPVYSESLGCLFPLACLSHTAWLWLLESWNFFGWELNKASKVNTNKEKNSHPLNESAVTFEQAFRETKWFLLATSRCQHISSDYLCICVRCINNNTSMKQVILKRWNINHVVILLDMLSKYFIRWILHYTFNTHHLLHSKRHQEYY